MKALFLVLALSFSTFAFAGNEISLVPGGSMTVNPGQPTQVRCLREVNPSLSTCQIRREGEYFCAYIGADFVENYSTLDAALRAVEKLRAAAMCR